MAKIYINKDYDIERREWLFEAIIHLDGPVTELPIPFKLAEMGRSCKFTWCYKEDSRENDKDFSERVNKALSELTGEVVSG